MLQNRNLQLHNTHLQVGPPPPTLACPYCPRHFYSKGGRTKHIQAKHDANGPNPHHASNVTLPPSPVPSLSQGSSSHNVQFERPPSSIPYSGAPSPPPSYGEVDAADNFADIDIDAEYPQAQFDRNDSIPPDRNELNEDLLPRDPTMEQPHAPNPPHSVTYIYHPTLNGTVDFSTILPYTSTDYYCF
jgi:hypothetical protein